MRRFCGVAGCLKKTCHAVAMRAMVTVSMQDARSTLTFLTVTAAAALAGCAADMPVADCASLDWRRIGETDGRSGLPAKDFETHAKKCPAGTADRVAYDAGRAAGLQFYCTRAGGLAAGALDAKYEGACALAGEAEFLDGYAFGEKLYELDRANRKAMVDYEKALSSLDQNGFLLRAAEKRTQKPSLSNEEREVARQEAAARAREISRLENSLTRLVNDIEATRAALDAWKAELVQMGLDPPASKPGEN